MIRNASKNTSIGEGVILKSVFSKAVGLMLCRKVKKPLVFVFSSERYIDLHMMFVFCPIDIILIGKDKRVVELKESFKPFTLFSSRKKAMYVIEAETGTIRKTRTEVGDMIIIISKFPNQGPLPLRNA